MPLNVKTVADSLFFSKNDPNDPRIGEITQSISLVDLTKTKENSWTLLGYPDDEGIQVNGGRTGARLAPDTIRNYLYRMTLPALKESKAKPQLFDLGNIEIAGKLEERHAFAQNCVKEILEANKKPITLGGGHDYGFPDAAAFIEYNLKKSSLRPIVMNFDSHLDVRPTNQGFHSGTPFYRLLEKFHEKIDFFEVGIQPQCNSISHKSWAQNHSAMILELFSVEGLDLLSAIQSSLKSDKREIFSSRPLWISLDIDVFRNSEAPGCSQSFATGLLLQEVLPVLGYLNSNFDLQGIGIYEVSPTLDQDDRTSKLAALILFHIIFPQLKL